MTQPFRCGNCETPHDSQEGADECCACPHCAELEEQINNQEMELQAIRKNYIVTFPRPHGGADVYDLSPAMKEGVLKDKLIELGWTPPSDD